MTVGIFGTGTDAESAAYTNRFGKDIVRHAVRRLHPEDILTIDRRGGPMGGRALAGDS